MKSARLAILLLLIVPLLAPAQKKKPKIPAVFNTARFVFVEAMDGDQFTPGLLREDRDAIYAVQDALQEWKRYSVTMNRKDADLLFVVRTGRRASAKAGGGIGTTQPTIGNQRPNQRSSRAEEVMMGGEVGPADDILQVYLMRPDGTCGALIWSRSQTEGLSEPDVLLVHDLKEVVERDYPSTAANSGNAAKP